jgi:hypothetical protein
MKQYLIDLNRALVTGQRLPTPPSNWNLQQRRFALWLFNRALQGDKIFSRRLNPESKYEIQKWLPTLNQGDIALYTINPDKAFTIDFNSDLHLSKKVKFFGKRGVCPGIRFTDLFDTNPKIPKRHFIISNKTFIPLFNKSYKKECWFLTSTNTGSALQNTTYMEK